MNSDYLIAGDWGTSTCRLYLLEIPQSGATTLIDTIEGDGVSAISLSKEMSFETVLLSLIDQWMTDYTIEKIILSGMIGSSIGWREALYTDCPASCLAHVKTSLNFLINGVSVSIMGGLKTQNPLGLSDTMRGEETQLLGLTSLIGRASSAAQIVALPGTHNKWALLEAGRVVNFITGFTGELFAVLREHTILLAQSEALDLSSDAFEQGVKTIIETNADLVHLLFNVRAQQLVDGKDGKYCLAYLLGMIVGIDIRGAMTLFSEFSDVDTGAVIVLGGEQHNQAYQRALKCFDIETKTYDANTVAIAAYSEMYTQLITL